MWISGENSKWAGLEVELCLIWLGSSKKASMSVGKVKGRIREESQETAGRIRQERIMAWVVVVEKATKENDLEVF